MITLTLYSAWSLAMFTYADKTSAIIVRVTIGENRTIWYLLNFVQRKLVTGKFCSGQFGQFGTGKLAPGQFR